MQNGLDTKNSCNPCRKRILQKLGRFKFLDIDNARDNKVGCVLRRNKIGSIAAVFMFSTSI